MTALATRSELPLLVYFSSVSENTARFIERFLEHRPDARVARIPLHRTDDPLNVEEPYVLITPTYGGGDGNGAVPKQVIRFLNDETNRTHIRGVIAAGNTNFGAGFGIAGDIISRKCNVPHLYRLELFGTQEDITRISEGMQRWWTQQ